MFYPAGQDIDKSASCKDCDVTSAYVRLFGITKEYAKKLVVLSHGACEICGTPSTNSRRLCLDHDHITNKIRGFLCDGCNTSIGGIKENLETIDNLIIYLNIKKKVNTSDEQYEDSE